MHAAEITDSDVLDICEDLVREVGKRCAESGLEDDLLLVRNNATHIKYKVSEPSWREALVVRCPGRRCTARLLLKQLGPFQASHDDLLA
jgi:hypothetical protein